MVEEGPVVGGGRQLAWMGAVERRQVRRGRDLVVDAGDAARADGQGRIGMTVELVYGHAYKVAPRARPGEPVTVSLDSLRASIKAPRRAS